MSKAILRYTWRLTGVAAPNVQTALLMIPAFRYGQVSGFVRGFLGLRP